MRTLGALSALALILASCAAPDPAPPETTTTVHEDDHEHLASEMIEWDGTAVPEVSVSVTGDNQQGWTVTASLTNFTLADMAATEHVPGEGHAHIWVDGQVFTMLTEESAVIPRLDPGTHEIVVTLSSNDHLDYVHEGEPLMARTTVEVEGEADDHPVIVVTIANGEATIDPTEPEVSVGETVELRITSDVTDSIHVHGYDVLGSLEPGAETIVRFTADVPGIFEVELESNGLHVFDLAVR